MLTTHSLLRAVASMLCRYVTLFYSLLHWPWIVWSYGTPSLVLFFCLVDIIKGPQNSLLWQFGGNFDTIVLLAMESFVLSYIYIIHVGFLSYFAFES